MRKTTQKIIACVIGTRPEAIKMAPVIFQLQACDWAKVLIINTAQHSDLLNELFDLFDLKPDVNLQSMVDCQSLGSLTARLCQQLDDWLQTTQVDVLLAVGDTTTVFISSLVAFYHKIPFGHIEAGLRTGHPSSPFPEEMNRTLTASLASWHFAPTDLEKENLLKECIPSSNILVTGNTVIDALQWVITHRPARNFPKVVAPLVVVTLHRRENWGKNLKNICRALISLSREFPELTLVLPLHPNPQVQSDIKFFLGNRPQIFLLPPLRYDDFIHLMNRSMFIMTDSGGIQEEAPALKKPVIILRDSSERHATIAAGVGLLAGTKTENILKAARLLLTDKAAYQSMIKELSPYGKGDAAEQIVSNLKHRLLILDSAPNVTEVANAGCVTQPALGSVK